DNGIMHHALYWNNSRDFWSKEAAKIVLLTIQTNSKFAGQYMYPNIFMCETYEGGMEYPGIVYIGPYQSGSVQHWSQNTMMHELGHQWYPMMMGSNETDYGYMDEGFNTFITTFVQEKYFGRWNNSFAPGLGYNDDERTSNYRAALMQQLSGNQEPSEQKADEYFSYRDYAEATYPHTSSVFFMLRYTMGDKAFDDFMHLYYERWRFKHPYPDDIMNAAEDIERREGDTNRVRARGDLRWFFDEWFNKTWKLDYAVDHFHVKGNTAIVTIEKKERAVMPIDLVFTFDDGTTEQKWIPVDDWLRTVADERTYTYTFTKHPVQVEINPSLDLLDVNRLNNTSCWLPPMEVDLVPKIFGDVKPINKYAVRSAPFIAPFDGTFQNRWAIGWTLLGSYLDRTDRIAIGFREAVSQHGFEGAAVVLQYHTVLDWLSPWTDVDIMAVPVDGGLLGLNLSQIVPLPGTTTPIHIFNVGYNLSGFPLAINHVFGGYTFHDESSINEFAFAGQVETGIGDPRANYSKLAGMIDDRLDIARDWNAFIRFFGGSMQPINGSVPYETLFQLASASDADHFSDFLGSNFGSGVRDKIRNAVASGPLVRGYLQNENLAGRVAASGTFEIGNRSLFPFTILREIPVLGRVFDMFGLTFFADAGLVTNAFCTCQLKSDLMSDAGVGLRFFGVDSWLNRSWNLDLDRTEAQIDFPLYLDKPVSGESKFDFRIVGMVRQNF
ncbi:MAG TPA: M1 family aminopeptidase, partial [Candidatus Kapabacteria bacterium]|nr:M1 family aminopeptidase [Candidatus Kapabacteria bacterium]